MARVRVRLNCGHGRLIHPGSGEAYDAVSNGWTWCPRDGMTMAIDGWMDDAYLTRLADRLILNDTDRAICIADARHMRATGDRRNA